MVDSNGTDLSVTPDGEYIATTPDYGRGLEVRWFRVADGRSEPPPGDRPRGFHLRQIHANGHLLVGNGEEYRWYASATSAEPYAVVEATNDKFYFDQVGKVCVKEAHARGDDYELLVARLTQPGVVRWQRIASKSSKFESVVLAASGSHVAWRDETSLHVHDLGTGKQRSITPQGGLKSDYGRLAISPDGKSVAWAVSASVRLFDVATGKQRREYAGCDDPQDTHFTPDGKTLGCLERKRWHLIPVDPGDKVKTVSAPIDHRLAAFALFPDGKRLAARELSGLLRIYDLHSGAQLDSHSRYPLFAGWQQIGRDTMLSWTQSGRMITWDLRTGKALSDKTLAIQGLRESVGWYEFSADGARVAAWTDKTCIVAEVRSGKVLARVGESDRIESVHFLRSGGVFGLIAPLNDETRALQRLDSEGPKGILQTLGGDRCLLSPDGRFCLGASAWSARLIEVATGKARWKGNLPRPEDPRGRETPKPQLAFDRAGRRAFVARDMDTTVFDVSSGKKLAVLDVSEPIAVSGCGRWVARRSWWMGDRDEIVFWDVEARYPADAAFRFPLPRAVSEIALDEDGSRLITAYKDGTYLVWDVAALRKFATPARQSSPWDQLGDLDAEKVVEPMQTLLADPVGTVRLFAQKLAPVPTLPAAQVAGWIAQLEADDYPRREAAEEQLKRELISCEGAIRAALAKAPLETRLRLKRLLRLADNRHRDPAWLRQVRAIEVLERIATKDAIALLMRLAAGASGASLTREASEALARLRE